MNTERPSKRTRLEAGGSSTAADIRARRSGFLSSLSRPVSPPNTPKDTPKPTLKQDPTKIVAVNHPAHPEAQSAGQPTHSSAKNFGGQILPSPFKLMRTRGLQQHQNIDTISLHDILGDPLIRQAWIFNFCFDVNWTMQHFDADVRFLVQVKIVHGSWKREDGNRKGIEDSIKHWKNVEEIRAYLPDAYGTHHSKMIILFKHDDTAQVIIHTANMLEKDWDHMTQAAWRSPSLPLLYTTVIKTNKSAVGSGSCFKADLLRYLKAYGNKLKRLYDQLAKHDFSQIRAALIASVPSHCKKSDPSDKVWGHLSLSKTLHSLRSANKDSHTPLSNSSHLISQVSSIATLPQTYLQDTLYKAVLPSTTSIIYPTPSDLRAALTGYATGGSIHIKTSTAVNQKQVALLRPQLRRWGTQASTNNTRAGRHMIPPHIKTYVNFVSKPTQHNPTPDINWALLTSANLSQQAWGTVPKLPKNSSDQGEAVVHIQSYEIGVLVWPELFMNDPGHDADDLGEKEYRRARMVPVFRKDMPEIINALQTDGRKDVLVGLRMPYDLPLTPYAADEMPWSPNQSYAEPDCLGRTWPP